MVRLCSKCHEVEIPPPDRVCSDCVVHKPPGWKAMKAEQARETAARAAPYSISWPDAVLECGHVVAWRGALRELVRCPLHRAEYLAVSWHDGEEVPTVKPMNWRRKK